MTDAKEDAFLKDSLAPADAPALSDRFQDNLHQRLASQSLSRAGRRRLNAYLLVSMLASTAAMWWLEIPWMAIAPAVLIPAIFFVLFQWMMWPKIRN